MKKKKGGGYFHAICFFILGYVYVTACYQYSVNPSSGIYLDMNVS